MDLATILDDCVRRMRGGESVEDCLADYPDKAAELAPMLRAACALQWLAGERMPEAHRQHTRSALRRVVTASQAMPKRPHWMAFWVRPAVRALAGTAAVLVFLAFAITTTAASRPGDLAYPARVMAERSTLLLQRTPDGQASASLRLANNRLSELEAGLALPGRAYNPALDALMAEDRSLADLTPRMARPMREQTARQVASHAAHLEQLAREQPEASSCGRVASSGCRGEYPRREYQALRRGNAYVSPCRAYCADYSGSACARWACPGGKHPDRCSCQSRSKFCNCLRDGLVEETRGYSRADRGRQGQSDAGV